MDSRRNMARYYRTVQPLPKPIQDRSQESTHADSDELQRLRAYSLAMVYAPVQCFDSIYDLSSAMNYGTIFKDLNMPFVPGKRC